MEGHDHEAQHHINKRLDLEALRKVNTDQMSSITSLEGRYDELQLQHEHTWEDYEDKWSLFKRLQSEITQHRQPSEEVSGDRSPATSPVRLQYCDREELMTRLTKVFGNAGRKPQKTYGRMSQDRQG